VNGETFLFISFFPFASLSFSFYFREEKAQTLPCENENKKIKNEGKINNKGEVENDERRNYVFWKVKMCIPK